MLCCNVNHNLSWAANGKVKPCNWLDTFPPKNSVEELVSSAEYQQLNNDNQNNIKSNFCQKCWDKESYGQLSKRETDNKVAQVYKKINTNFLKIDAALDNNCNAACVICNPMSSSMWQKELYGKIITVEKSKSFWNHIFQNRNDVVQLDFGGGEPWLNDVPQQITLLQTLIDEGLSKKIKLRYNTNGSIFPKKLVDLFDKFREVEITVSIDDSAHRFEYNRYPLKWDKVYQNFALLVDLAKNSATIKITINYTVSVFTFLYFEPFVEYSNEVLKVTNISTSVLHTPIEYNIKSLPQQYKEKIPKTNIFYNLISTDPLDNWSERFFTRIDALDKRRNTSFETTFPELYNILF